MLYNTDERKLVESEFKRMGFAQDSRWRISEVNRDYQFCASYPRFLIFPTNFSDADLESVAKFRHFRRVPTAVWRHKKNGCFIVRTSQPAIGWFGWFRNEHDEALVQAYVKIAPSNCETARKNNEHKSKNGDSSFIEQPEQQQQEQHSKQPQQSENTSESSDTIGSATCTTLEERRNDDNETSSQDSQISQQSQITTIEVPPSPSQTSNNNNNHSDNIQDTKPHVIGNGTNTAASTESADRLSTSTNGIVTSFLGNNLLPRANLITAFSPISTTPAISSKLLIIDARGYAAAMANRAKGGGCECSDYYQACEVQFMNLANIHSIRKSFHAIRTVCEAYSEQSNNWLSFLDNSKWLHHISGLLKSALLIVDTVDTEEKSTLIHCSDGWDRTPQIIALAEIMLDPYYRTFEGFRTLVQREWLDFGHKFADRCGNNPSTEDPNERCPVFLQWLDCVQQLLMQYPDNFEFNSSFLDKLNRHTYSNVFGTFSYNSGHERYLARVDDKTFSLWLYFESAQNRFRNEKYMNTCEILRPSCKVKDLNFWTDVYITPFRNNQASCLHPFTRSFDNRRFYDSLSMEELPRTVCK